MHDVIVTGIILKNNKFLIIKRSPKEKRWPNKWTIPGGKLELDYSKSPVFPEAFEYTLKKEIKEETNLKVKNIRYLKSSSFLREDKPCLLITLFVEYSSGNVKLNEEATDFAWVTLEKAKNYDLIEGIYKELEMLDKKLKNERNNTGKIE